MTAKNFAIKSMLSSASPLGVLTALTLVAVLFCLPSGVAAHDHHGHGHGEEHHDHHDHAHGSGPGAHVHGLAELNLILEDSRLIIDMLSPAMNKVGFEHQPRDREQREKIEQAIELLHDGESMFSFPAAARCRLIKAEADAAFDLEPPPEHRHENPDQHGKAAGHDHDHDDHADFSALWEFHCERPEHLSHIDFRLFQAFPATHRLRIQAITPAGQKGAELRPAEPRFDL